MRSEDGELLELRKAQRLIQRHGLHTPLTEPVSLDQVMDAFSIGYRPLDHRVMALTMRWYDDRRHHIAVSYNMVLREPSETARKRHAQAHELAHIVLGHRGSLWVMWRGERPSAFDRHLDALQERQCDRFAAFVLVPLDRLLEHEGDDAHYVALVLDVPVSLVKLRNDIWRKHGR